MCNLHVEIAAQLISSTKNGAHTKIFLIKQGVHFALVFHSQWVTFSENSKNICIGFAGFTLVEIKILLNEAIEKL